MLGANREEIEQGAVEFGIDLWEHVANVIEAMNLLPMIWVGGCIKKIIRM